MAKSWANRYCRLPKQELFVAQDIIKVKNYSVAELRYEEKVNDIYKYPAESSKKEFVSGESMMLMGRNCTLLVVDENIRGIKFDGFSFRISKNNQERAHNLFVSWYKKYALSQIEPMAKSFAQRLGVTYNGCSVTDTMKYRWASCTPKGNVNFN